MAARHPNPWRKEVWFKAEVEHERDTKFIRRLGLLGQEFTVPREQLRPLMEELKIRISLTGEPSVLPGE